MNRTLDYINGDTLCFGCGVCAAVCPKNCIQLKPDSDGFLFPEIDFAVCVRCRRCINCCPAGQKAFRLTLRQAPEFFAVRHADPAVRKASTSGGLFTALSDIILKRGGAVAGAVMKEDFSVVHVIANDAAGRNAMRYSKYVQSDCSRIFTPIAGLLRAGREVLFTGTPCQVAALYGFLDNEPENLYTADFICHGVPSPMVFDLFRRDLAARFGAPMVSFRFRDQQRGCVPMRIGAEFANGAHYLEDCEHDPYFQLFLSSILNRECCSKCPYTKVHRSSDLTLGDCWRFASFAPQWDDNTGVSTLLVNTKKGKKLFEDAAGTLEKEPCSLREVDQHYLHHPGKRHPDRDLFFRAIRRHGFAAAQSYIGPRPFLRRVRGRLRKLFRRDSA